MVPLTSSVAKIFGSQAMERYGSDLTLMEAAERSVDSNGNDTYARLLKQSTAALLNSYSRSGYPYSAWEVKTLFLQALVSEEAASSVANRLATANHACN